MVGFERSLWLVVGLQGCLSKIKAARFTQLSSLPAPPSSEVERKSEPMAFMKKAASKKEEEEKRQPDLIARCKQSPDSDYWLTCGAAWIADINGKKGYSVRLHTLPVNFDGSFLLMPPKEE